MKLPLEALGGHGVSLCKDVVVTGGSRVALRGRGRRLGGTPPPKSSDPSSSGDEGRRLLLMLSSHHGHTLPFLLFLYSSTVASWSLLNY